MDREARQIGKLIAQQKRGVNQENKIEEIVWRIKEYMTKRKISSFSRDFLMGMLKTYTKIPTRTLQNTIKQVIPKLIKIEVVRTVTYLELDKKRIDRIRRQKNLIEKHYCFKNSTEKEII